MPIRKRNILERRRAAARRNRSPALGAAILIGKHGGPPMPLDPFDALFAHADSLAARVPVAVAGGDDPTVREATQEAARRGWVEPHLFDDATEAVASVRAGRCRLLMKGQIATPALMQAVLAAGGLRTGRVIAQVVL